MVEHTNKMITLVTNKANQVCPGNKANQVCPGRQARRVGTLPIHDWVVNYYSGAQDAGVLQHILEL